MRSTRLFALVFVFSLSVMALIGLAGSEPIWSDLPRFASVSVFAALQALAVTVLEALARGSRRHLGGNDEPSTQAQF